MTQWPLRQREDEGAQCDPSKQEARNVCKSTHALLGTQRLVEDVLSHLLATPSLDSRAFELARALSGCPVDNFPSAVAMLLAWQEFLLAADTPVTETSAPWSDEVKRRDYGLEGVKLARLAFDALCEDPSQG